MTIKIESSFAFDLEEPSDVLLQFEAAMIPEQYIASVDTQLSPAEHIARVPAQDGIGERIWVRAQGAFEVGYTAEVEVRRQLPELAGLGAVGPHEMPGEVVPYLFASRYCPAQKFQSFADAEFGHLAGGEKITAMADWVAKEFRYTPGSSDANTTALDSFVERRGICRDYAHVMVTLARAATIPARFVSCYAPGVTPQDFHAVAEVFLADPELGEGATGGTWQLVDATQMAKSAKIVKIGVGRDAADVSFLTSFGLSQFRSSNVAVSAS